MTTLHQLKNTSRPKANTKRLGRGPGSKKGKTCGRGYKGAGSRSGWTARHTYEGGQMRLFMKTPIKGFSNAKFTTKYEPVNFDLLNRYYEDGQIVDHESLKAKGLISKVSSKVKLLANGEPEKKYAISLDAASASAIEKCQNANISLTLFEGNVGR